MADKRKARVNQPEKNISQRQLRCNKNYELKYTPSNWTILNNDNQRLQAENQALYTEVNKLKSQLQQKKGKKLEDNNAIKIRELEDQMNALKAQVEQEKESHALQAKLEKQKLADSMRQIKMAVLSSVTLLLKEMEEKMCNTSQLYKRIEELNNQTAELAKQLDKERDYSHTIQNQKMLDSMKQFKMMCQAQAQSVSTMKTEILTRSDELNKQFEEWKNQTGKLVKRIDKEKDHHARRLGELRKEFISKKENLFEQHTTKLEKDIIVRMNGCCTKIQSTNSTLVYATGILKKINARKLEDEEESYKFTNAFTSAGEGSVLDISKRYRHLQHNMRASAVRASKQVYRNPAKAFFCKQTMNAYEAAKTVLLEESGKCIYMHLIKLQASGEVFNEKMLNACMRIVDYGANDEVTNNAIKRITGELKLRDAEERNDAAKDDSLAPDVAKYYHTLAELTWQAISRPIPMVYEMEEKTYKKDLHDIKDGDSNDEGKAVVYVYPVLYSSNQWPRQVAQIGRVELDE